MEKILNDVSLNLDYFILIFLRVSALIISSPIFGRRNLPNILKIAFCILLTYVMFAANPISPKISYTGVLGFALLCIKELLFGLALGYVTTLFFSIAQTAGYVVDMQMGFSIVNAFDVQSSSSVSVTGNFLYIVMIISFLSTNGHLQLIRIVQATLTNIPVGSVALSPKIGLTALEVFAQAFVLALNVAMPVIASGLLGELIMGFIVRTVPQMNVFVIGIPLKILLGLMVLLIMLPVYVAFTGSIYKTMYAGIEKMFSGLVMTT
jgi:flagellar biosynthetic protein FliR